MGNQGGCKARNAVAAASWWDRHAAGGKLSEGLRVRGGGRTGTQKMGQEVLREPAQCRGGIRAGIKSTNTDEGEEDEVLCKGEEASRWMEASLARIAGRDELQWLQHVSAHFIQPLELWTGRYSTTKARGRFTTAWARKPLKPTGGQRSFQCAPCAVRP